MTLVRSTLPPVAELRLAARHCWPEGPLHRFVVHNEGWSNLVLEADGSIMFRFPRRESLARRYDKEVHELEGLAKHLYASIPDPVLISTLDRPRGWPFIAYRKVPGVPLVHCLPLSETELNVLRRFLLRLFRELAAIRPAEARSWGVPGASKATWTEGYRRLWERYLRVVAPRVSSALTRLVQEEFESFFLAMRRSSYRSIVIHRDLGPEHVLWDPAGRRPTGVIDWEDVELGDPAFDLTGWGDFGPFLMGPLRKMRKLPGDDQFDARLHFYRRIQPIHGLLLGFMSRRDRFARRHAAMLERFLLASQSAARIGSPAKRSALRMVTPALPRLLPARPRSVTRPPQ